MYAARIGNESVGISFDEADLRKARVRAKLLKLDTSSFLQADLQRLDELSPTLGMFDQVVCLETIEHIENDKKLLADLSGLLKPGGQLLLSAPFKHYRPLFGDRISHSGDGGHVRWGYTHAELKDLFDAAGLDVRVQEYVSGIVSQQITNLERILSRVGRKFAWATTFPLRVFQPLDSALSKLTRYPYLSVAVVGVRRTTHNH